jgi:hypothetical protein
VAMHQNEIRDYLERAPKKWNFDGRRMVNNTHVRFVWLADLARGPLDERINRRAGLIAEPLPWKHPVHSSCRRHHRNELRKQGRRSQMHLI